MELQAIFPQGKQGPSNLFTDAAYNYGLLPMDSTYTTLIGNVYFEPMAMIYKGNENFRKKMDEIEMKYEYVETTGGHTWNNWRDYLSRFVQLIFKG